METQKSLEKRLKKVNKPIEKWGFELYISGMNPRSVTSLLNLKDFCRKYLNNQADITIIDLSKQPQIAIQKQIFAIPTLIKVYPAPICRSIGDLSNIENLLQQFKIE